MKKIVVFASFVILSAFMISTSSMQVNAGSGFCFNCGSGSSCQQCESPSGKDTSADRKTCENRGCKITGTSSCSTAANVKKC